MQKNQAQVSRADDRPNDMLAVSKMFNPATPVKKYSPVLMRKLNEGQQALAKSGDKGVAAVANMTGKTEEEVKEGLSRKNKFCGGMSKPYSRKK